VVSIIVTGGFSTIVAGVVSTTITGGFSAIVAVVATTVSGIVS
jgi:hypothetical protein